MADRQAGDEVLRLEESVGRATARIDASRLAPFMRAVARRNETRRARFSPPLSRRQQSFCPPYGST